MTAAAGEPNCFDGYVGVEGRRIALVTADAAAAEAWCGARQRARDRRPGRNPDARTGEYPLPHGHDAPTQLCRRYGPHGVAQRPYLAFRSAPDRRRHPRGRTARCGRNAAGRRDVGRGHVLVGGGGFSMRSIARGCGRCSVRATSIRGSKPSKATCPRSSRNARDRRLHPCGTGASCRLHLFGGESAARMEACRRYGIPMTTHIAETLDEVRMIRERYGATPVEYLDSLGVLDGGLIAAHCVHLTDGDRRILRERGVHVAHCPTSNMKIARRCRADRTAAHRRGELHGGHRRPQFEQRSGHVGGDAQRFVPAKGDDDGSLCRAGLRTAPHGDGLRCGRHRPCRRVGRGEGGCAGRSGIALDAEASLSSAARRRSQRGLLCQGGRCRYGGGRRRSGGRRRPAVDGRSASLYARAGAAVRRIAGEL